MLVSLGGLSAGLQLRVLRRAGLCCSCVVRSISVGAMWFVFGLVFLRTVFCLGGHVWRIGFDAVGVEFSCLCVRCSVFWFVLVYCYPHSVFCVSWWTFVESWLCVCLCVFFLCHGGRFSFLSVWFGFDVALETSIQNHSFFEKSLFFYYFLGPSPQTAHRSSLSAPSAHSALTADPPPPTPPKTTLPLIRPKSVIFVIGR